MSAEVLKSEIELPAAKKMKLLDTRCVLRFAKLTVKAFEPVRGSARAAGVDLRSAYDIVVPARGKALVKTDLQVQVPEGSYGRIAPRSGLAVKNFIDVGAGVVDEDYRGNLGVVLFNHSDEEFEVKRGDRIAQFICERIFYPELEEVEKLDDTVRGEAGFGSTGVKEMPVKNGTAAVTAAAESMENGTKKAASTAESDDAEKKVEQETNGKTKKEEEKAEVDEKTAAKDAKEKNGGDDAAMAESESMAA